MTETINSQQDTVDLRIGVYVCRCGGNISDVIDVEQVAEAARHIPGVSLARVHTFMCSDPGQQAIQDDIRSEGLNRVVVASCSPALHELTFRQAVARGGLNPYLYEHVNIREQGSWAHKHDPQGATAKAVRMIAAAVGKLRYAQPLEEIHLPNHRTALVIGGGIAGMKAAADLARRGIHVILVEKEAELGGMLNRLGRVFPGEEPANELVRALQARLEGVEVLTLSQVTQITGFLGNYQVTIAGCFGPDEESATAQVTVGAVILATGFTPYAPGAGEHGYGQERNVLTMLEFITLLEQADANTLTHHGRPVRSIAFLHCVGSRQVDGVHEPQADGNVNTYCSRVCCTTTLQQAVRVKERFPQINVFDLHQDIRTYGRGHEDYYTRASKAGVIFFRYHGEEPPVVEPHSGGNNAPPLQVTVTDWLTWGEQLTVPVDLVVLAVGMMPGQIGGLIDMLKLPVGEDRFLQEIHPKLRPVEVSVPGVLLAGTAQGPMNIVESLDAGAAAAVKASAMLAHDEVEVNPYVAAVDERLCTGTGACVGECEYDAVTLVEREVNGQRVRRAEVNPGLCAGCGACVAVCPHRAINLNGWRLDQYDAMVDGLTAELAGTGGQS